MTTELVEQPLVKPVSLLIIVKVVVDTNIHNIFTIGVFVVGDGQDINMVGRLCGGELWIQMVPTYEY